MARWRRVWFYVLLNYLYCQSPVQYIQGFQPDSTSESGCLPGEFSNSTGAGPIGCLPCSSCGEGEGIAEHCHNVSDTQCRQCREESYSDVTSLGRECQNCTECSPSRIEASPCSLDEDTICGPCAPAYFLYIDSNGAQCKECSQCPEDRVTIHWIECAEAGLPQDQQCAPEEVPTENTTTTSTQDPTPNTSAITETPPTSEDSTPFSLPTDRGGFISQPEAGLITVATPDKAVGIAITGVSILFTILTIVVFVAAFGCLFWRTLKKCQSRYCRVAEELSSQRCLSVIGRCCRCRRRRVEEPVTLQQLLKAEEETDDGGSQIEDV